MDGVEAFDGYSRFWFKQAVLGAYWVAQKIGETKIRIHLTDDIELEGFEEALSFSPDREFKQELLAKCDWEEVITQILPEQDTRLLSLFEEEEDG